MTETLIKLIEVFSNGKDEIAFIQNSNNSWVDSDVVEGEYIETYRHDFICDEDFITEVQEYEKNNCECPFVTEIEPYDNRNILWVRSKEKAQQEELIKLISNKFSSQKFILNNTQCKIDGTKFIKNYNSKMSKRDINNNTGHLSSLNIDELKAITYQLEN